MRPTTWLPLMDTPPPRMSSAGMFLPDAVFGQVASLAAEARYDVG
jgi:hypothetical protein